MTPTVAILLCTYNGELFIEEQLQSLHNQTHPNIDVWVSDDGSNDGTLKYLKKYQSSWQKGSFNILQGPRKGYALNFLFLVCNTSISADYYAFCDQDDIWFEEKLETAITFLQKYTTNSSPALYGSATELIRETGESLHRYSMKVNTPPCFKNALVQNIAGGNTMVFNQPARELVLSIGMVDIVSHDWWLYLVLSGTGGAVVYDQKPSLQYRQHRHNSVGENTTVPSQIKRLKQLISGRFKGWNKQNINALLLCKNRLTPQNNHTLDYFCICRNANMIIRLSQLRKSGVYRQSILGNLGLIIAAILNKL